MSYGVSRRHGSGLMLPLLWQWCRPAAVVPIGPLAWEPPCAVGVALKKKAKKKKKRNETHQGWLGICDLFFLTFFTDQVTDESCKFRIKYDKQ